MEERETERVGGEGSTSAIRSTSSWLVSMPVPYSTTHMLVIRLHANTSTKKNPLIQDVSEGQKDILHPFWTLSNYAKTCSKLDIFTAKERDLGRGQKG